MATDASPDPVIAPAGRAPAAANGAVAPLGSETLYAVIGVVASAPDLDRVLDGIVDLLSEATRLPRLLRLPARRRAAAAARRVADLRAPRRPGRDGARRGPRRLGRAQRDAGVHPRARDGRPAHEVLRRDRGGALPVDGRGPDPGPVRLGARRRRPAHGRAARVRRGRAHVPRPHRVARRRGDRERAALRGHAPPRRGAHAAVQPVAVDRRCGRPRGAVPRRHRGRPRRAALRHEPALPPRPRGGPPRARGGRPARTALVVARGRGHGGPARHAPPPRPGAGRGRHDARRAGRRRRRAPRRARRDPARARRSARRPTSCCARSPTSSRSRSTRPS